MLPRGHFFPAPAGQDELTALDPALAAQAWLSLLSCSGCPLCLKTTCRHSDYSERGSRKSMQKKKIESNSPLASFCPSTIVDSHHYAW